MPIRSELAACAALALAFAAAPSLAQDKTSIADKPAKASAATKAVAPTKQTNAAGAKLLVDRSVPAQMSTPAASRVAPLGEPATKACHDKGSDA